MRRADRLTRIPIPISFLDPLEDKSRPSRRRRHLGHQHRARHLLGPARSKRRGAAQDVCGDGELPIEHTRLSCCDRRPSWSGEVATSLALAQGAYSCVVGVCTTAGAHSHPSASPASGRRSILNRAELTLSHACGAATRARPRNRSRDRQPVIDQSAARRHYRHPRKAQGPLRTSVRRRRLPLPWRAVPARPRRLALQLGAAAPSSLRASGFLTLIYVRATEALKQGAIFSKC